MSYSKIISPLTLLFEVSRNEDMRAVFNINHLNSILSVLNLGEPTSYLQNSFEQRGYNVNKLMNNIEVYLRKMITNCAQSVLIPACGKKNRIIIKKVKTELTPTTNKIIRLIDQSHNIWSPIRKYFEPIHEEIGKSEKISFLVWNFYLLSLAIKYDAELIQTPDKMLVLIKEIKNNEKLDSECLARLSIIEGIYNSFSVKIEMPTLRFLPGISSMILSERIAEIKEDAYLLEASHLRKSLGIKRNYTAIKRSMRKLLMFIKGNRAWAKDILTIGSDILAFSDPSTKILNNIVDIIPKQVRNSSPILINKDENIYFPKEAGVQLSTTLSDDSAIIFDSGNAK